MSSLATVFYNGKSELKWFADQNKSTLNLRGLLYGASICEFLVSEKGSWGGEFHPELLPQHGDLIAQNHWTASGFANTNLDFLLKQHNIDHVVIAGMKANTCIDTTSRYAVELGYHIALIKDAIAAFNWDEIKAPVEVNFPNYGHKLLSTEDFIDALK
jgi:nicotinamidase-related amidase